MRVRGLVLVFYLVLALVFGPVIASAGMVREPETRVAVSVFSRGLASGEDDLETRIHTGEERLGHDNSQRVHPSSPFGELLTGDSETAFGFQGLRREWLGSEGGGELYGAQFRHVSPHLGRWLKRDPVGFRDGTNLYLAFRNNPARYMDPSGRNALAIVAAAAVALTYGYLEYQIYQESITPSDSVAKMNFQPGIDFLSNSNSKYLRHIADRVTRDARFREASTCNAWAAYFDKNDPNAIAFASFLLFFRNPTIYIGNNFESGNGDTDIAITLIHEWVSHIERGYRDSGPLGGAHFDTLLVVQEAVERASIRGIRSPQLDALEHTLGDLYLQAMVAEFGGSPTESQARGFNIRFKEAVGAMRRRVADDTDF